MAERVLRIALRLPGPRHQVFPFFASAPRLQAITPPELHLRILSPPSVPLQRGTLCEYAMSLLGVPIRWRTLITAWDPPHGFVDEQLTGPFAHWVHRHTFSDLPDGGTLVQDEVRYRLPFAPLGHLGYLLMRRQLQRLLRYRLVRVRDLLTVPAQNADFAGELTISQ